MDRRKIKTIIYSAIFVLIGYFAFQAYETQTWMVKNATVQLKDGEQLQGDLSWLSLSKQSYVLTPASGEKWMFPASEVQLIISQKTE